MTQYLTVWVLYPKLTHLIGFLNAREKTETELNPTSTVAALIETLGTVRSKFAARCGPAQLGRHSRRCATAESSHIKGDLLGITHHNANGRYGKVQFLGDNCVSDVRMFCPNSPFR
ncbi:MAG: hypothetical protein ACR2HX_10485 [Pyrinomonadaceae bacterium]